MANGSESVSGREQKLHQVLALVIETSESGGYVDRQQVLAEHPELAHELEEFFNDQQALAGVFDRVKAPHEPRACPNSDGAGAPTPAGIAAEDTVDSAEIPCAAWRPGPRPPPKSAADGRG